MSEPSLQAVRRVVEGAIERGDIPGAVALVRRRGEIVLHEFFGAASLEPAYRPMALHTVFDLASLTKPLAATPVILGQAEQGLLGLDEPAAVHLFELRGSAYEGVTIRQLLTHSAGLPGWYPTYATAGDRREVPRIIAGLQPSSPAGTRVEYTCLGFILLGFIVERLIGRPLDELAAEMIFEPLGLHETGYRPPWPAERYAVTERGNEYEQKMASDLGLVYDDWRTDFYPGVVNDGNAHYALGGCSGNAGLFGTAHEVGILGEMWRRGGEYEGARILSPRSVEEATREWTLALNEARGLGWQINHRRPGEAAPLSSGRRLSGRAFGHTGFTGTSLWIDPEHDLVAVLLTNRTHPVVGNPESIHALRSSFHDAVVSSIAAEAGRAPAVP